MNARERQILVNQDLHEFVALSRRINSMPIKRNPEEPHEKWVFLLARREVCEGNEVIVNGRLTGGRGFPDIAVCGFGHKIIEVLWSETLEDAKEKVKKYPDWDVHFFDAKKEKFV